MAGTVKRRKATKPRKVVPAADWKVLRAAIDASGLPDSRFAVEVLGYNDRTIRRYLARVRQIPGPVLATCRLVLANAEGARNQTAAAPATRYDVAVG